MASLIWLEVEPRFAFHVMNAFDADGGVAVDVVEYDRAPMFPNADCSPPDPSPSRLCRWHIDPAGRQPMRREVLDETAGEFPRIDERRAGLPYRHGFRLGREGEANAILHHDLQQRTRRRFILPEGEQASEQVFVPRAPDAPEGEGWLMTVAWRPKPGVSELWVLDAQAIERGPVAVIRLPQRVPFGFHGSWVPAERL